MDAYLPVMLLALLGCSSTAETKTRVVGLDGGPADAQSECQRVFAEANAINEGLKDAGSDASIGGFIYQGKCVLLCANATGILEHASGLCAEYGAECTDPEPWDVDAGSSKPSPYDQYCAIAVATTRAP
jgi:hypothetical protein